MLIQKQYSNNFTGNPEKQPYFFIIEEEKETVFNWENIESLFFFSIISV